MFLTIGWLLAGIGVSALWVGALLEQDLSVITVTAFAGAAILWIAGFLLKRSARRRLEEEQKSRLEHYGSIGEAPSYAPLDDEPTEDRRSAQTPVYVRILFSSLAALIGLASMFVVYWGQLTDHHGSPARLVSAALPFLTVNEDGELVFDLEKDLDIPDQEQEQSNSIDLRDAAQVQEILDELIAMAGNDEVVEVMFYKDRITGEFAIEPGSEDFDQYQFTVRSGYQHKGPLSVQPNLDWELPFRLSEFDPAVFARIWPQLAEQTGINPDTEDGNVHFRLERPNQPDNPDQELRITAIVSSDGHADYAVFDTAGDPLSDRAGEFDVRDAAQMQEILDELITLAGHDEVASLRIYSTHISADFAVSPGAARFDEYRYHENIGYSDLGAAAVQPDLQQQTTFHLNTFDPEVLAKIWDRLEQDTGFDPETATQEPTFRVEQKKSSDGSAQQITIRVLLGDDQGNGWADYTLNGELISASN